MGGLDVVAGVPARLDWCGDGRPCRRVPCGIQAPKTAGRDARHHPSGPDLQETEMRPHSPPPGFPR